MSDNVHEDKGSGSLCGETGECKFKAISFPLVLYAYLPQMMSLVWQMGGWVRFELSFPVELIFLATTNSNLNEVPGQRGSATSCCPYSLFFFLFCFVLRHHIVALRCDADTSIITLMQPVSFFCFRSVWLIQLCRSQLMVFTREWFGTRNVNNVH